MSGTVAAGNLLFDSAVSEIAFSLIGGEWGGVVANEKYAGNFEGTKAIEHFVQFIIPEGLFIYALKNHCAFGQQSVKACCKQ